MRTSLKIGVLAAGLAGALALGAASTSYAAPVLSNTAAVKSAAAGDTINVRWRGGRVGAGVAAGLAFGAIAGAAAAASSPYYYDTDPYYYGPGYSYGYAPGYYGYRYSTTQPGYPVRPCDYQGC